ncbi:Molybdenum ABC transporter ATP-binding protein ModC (plasmid) [Cupriavidus sp. U2]|uniref:ABC transporter ATP-binding protein n=1 Tax=Cupriavidus sp. U2 TaxID=2920269 RepID=UPI00129E6B8D|nr:ABC transporter ATP-binding protein [Cupriavidus sp. U2]KAI3590391.1 Molybdenum ABC transporter ATP-binding protein ModC [Cupriavidus sp. U2]
MDAMISAALEVLVEQTRPMPLSAAFRCQPNELLALVGPSGAGKTSVLRVLSGLMKPERGRVIVAGQIWCDTDRGIFVPPQRRHVGLVFQNYALMPHLSAQENVELSLLHLSPRARRAQAIAWLEHMHLAADVQARRPSALSGGQQQRVALARALAREPKLLLLDEPFSAVDQMSRQALYRLLADLRSELAIPMLLVTHDLNEARLLADHLVVMDGGEVLQEGPPQSIQRKPRNARVADLLGIQNHFHGTWEGPADAGTARLRWTVPGVETRGPVLTVRDKGRIPVGQAVRWVVPGDAITLHEPSSAAPSDLPAQVVDARHLGELLLVSLSLTSLPAATLRLTLSGVAPDRFPTGATLAVRLDSDLIHVMPLRQHPS